VSDPEDVKDEIEKLGEKKEIVIIEKPTKPENKQIDFTKIEKILVVLSDDELFTSLFYDVFIENISNYSSLDSIEFAYSINEIKSPINNTLIIGPISSKDLSLLPPLLGTNTFIMTLSNDYSLMKNFANDEIIFIPNSPYLHVQKLQNYIDNGNTVGVLYKQNDYGLKVFTYFKKIFPLIYTKSSPYGSSAIDLELSVNLLGNLDDLDNIIIIDDTISYKDLIGYLATDTKTYPLDEIYLIDNFLEQRINLENYYKPINRSNFDMIDLSLMREPHREYLFKQSIEISLEIAVKIFQQKMYPQNIDHPVLGSLPIKKQMIEYPIIFD
tara:strand:- start:1237 stop:2214 length:978 start_codon:yes stop_codon:yes gene_type:complete